MVDLASNIWRDFATAGIPASGANKPRKSKIREWGTYIESLTQAANYGNTVWFSTKALLGADLAHDAGTPAIVYADTTAANNGIYIKSGASGAGSWGQIITYLPGYQFVTATDAGAGTANAIVATSAPRVAYADGVQLIRLNIYETNTSGTVTVAFDGGAALAIKTASNNNPAIGGLVSGMTVLGVVDQSASVFRMLSDQTSSAIQTAAEAAQAAAEAAQAIAEAAAASAAGAKPYSTRTAIRALETPSANDTVILTEAGRSGTFVFRSGDYSTEVAADTVGGVYLKADDTAATSGAWVRYFDGAWNPSWFGCAMNGDGAGGGTDDEANFAVMLSVFALAGGGEIDLAGRTMRIDDQITLPGNIHLTGGKMDFTNTANDTLCITTGGSDGTTQSIGTLSAGASSVAVTSGAAFAAKDLVWIKSANVYSFSASTKGEWQRVRSVSSNTLNLYGRLRMGYSTTVVISAPAMKFDIKINNMVFIGGGDAQNATCLRLSYVKDASVTNCTFRDFGDRCVDIRRSLDVTVTACTMEHAEEDEGLGYGVAIVNGVERATVTGCTGSDLRHGVTIGGEDGVDRFITVSTNTFTNMADSAVDIHPNVQYATLDANVIDCGHFTADPDANRHGITCQGAHCTVSNNIIHNCASLGIHAQPLTYEDNDTLEIIGNRVWSDGSNITGIFVDGQKPSGTLRGCVVSGNVVYLQTSTSVGIEVHAATAGGTIDGVAITGNRVQSAGPAIRVRADASRICQDVAITGNALRNAGTGSAIELINGTTGAYLTCVTITGNTIRGGTYGINAAAGSFNADRVLAGENTIQAHSTGATNGTFSGTSNNQTS